jgi:hypothetical protein
MALSGYVPPHRQRGPRHFGDGVLSRVSLRLGGRQRWRPFPSRSGPRNPGQIGATDGVATHRFETEAEMPGRGAGETGTRAATYAGASFAGMLAGRDDLLSSVYIA